MRSVVKNTLCLLLLLFLGGCLGLLIHTHVKSPEASLVGIPVGFLLGYFGWALFARMKWVDL